MEKTSNSLETSSENILEVKNLYKSFRTKGSFFKKPRVDQVLKGISFQLKKGEILGIVGESGCGKSTSSNIIVKLIEADSGEVYFKGENILEIDEGEFRHRRPEIQLISQNPYKSFNPKFTIEEILLEGPIEHFNKSRESLLKECKEVLKKCGLPSDSMERYPHEFSGGQLQRISIARSLLMGPDLILADEIVSALDMSSQREILDLLINLKEEEGLSIIFISHDLGVIRKISDQIIVMKEGEIVDRGSRYEIFHKSKNLYTKKLIQSIPYFKY